MLNKKFSDRITQVLEADLALREFVDGMPAVVLSSRRLELPNGFLMVGVDLKEKAVDLSIIALVSRKIISLSKNEHLFSKLSGLELLFRVLRSGVAHRVLRISIQGVGVDHAARISVEQLLEKEPFFGCGCIIYEKTLRPLSAKQA